MSVEYKHMLYDVKEARDLQPVVKVEQLDPKSTKKRSRSTTPRERKGVVGTSGRRCFSAAWKYFTSITPKEAKCKLCKKTIKVAGGTSNLRSHLKKWHNSVFTELDKASKPDNTDGITIFIGEVVDNPDLIPECRISELPTDECLPSTSKASPCSKGTKRQITKEDTSARVKSFKSGDKLDAVITDAILYMVCKDALPLSATENEGLKFLLKTIVPLYEVPGRKKVTSLLEKKNSSLREVVEQQLSQATWVSVTADQASVTTKGYLIVNGHYIDSGCLRNVCLGVAKLTPGRKGEQIANDLTQILHSWNLETRKICSITTDGGANITAAVRKLMNGEHSHIPCLAHLINQCVCQALSQSDKATAVIEKVKRIVAYFQRSISASDALREMQCQNGVLVPLELIEAVVTQWNSTFYLLERFNQLAGCISKVLVSGDHWTAPPMLTAKELAVVTDLVTVLRPFERATREVSGDRFITASKILPIVNCLQRAVANASFVSEDVMAFNDALLDQIGQKLLPLEDNNLLASATVMDPRFKMIHFRSLINSDKILQWISQEMQAFTQDDPSEDKNTNQSEVESNVDDSLWEIHDQLAKQTAAAVELPPGSSAELHPELKLYLNMPTVPRAECPLRLWLDLNKTFPTLARLAGKYLTVMGSAVASERIVSRLNATPTDLRSSLSPAHINMLVFLSSLEHKTWFGGD